MQLQLSHADIAKVLKSTPEQELFDWKQDFPDLTDDKAKGEIVKDISAIANATAFTRKTGYIFYGVHPQKPDAVVGVSRSWDDAKLQQLVRSAVEPNVDFLYYETIEGAKTVSVVEVAPTREAFHVISRDLGSVREGQILVRQGSATRGIKRTDLLRLYLTPGLGYADQVIRNAGLHIAGREQDLQYAEQLERKGGHLVRQIETLTGLPKGTLG